MSGPASLYLSLASVSMSSGKRPLCPVSARRVTTATSARSSCGAFAWKRCSTRMMTALLSMLKGALPPFRLSEGALSLISMNFSVACAGEMRVQSAWT